MYHFLADIDVMLSIELNVRQLIETLKTVFLVHWKSIQPTPSQQVYWLSYFNSCRSTLLINEVILTDLIYFHFKLSCIHVSKFFDFSMGVELLFFATRGGLTDFVVTKSNQINPWVYDIVDNFDNSTRICFLSLGTHTSFLMYRSCSSCFSPSEKMDLQILCLTLSIW